MKDNLFNCLLDCKTRYVSIPKTIANWYQFAHKKYTCLTLSDTKIRFKRSETIFILGSGESINDITDEQWNYISKHDSFGMNKWPIHDFIPTFYYTNYPRKKAHLYKYLNSVKGSLRRYNKTVFFISFDRATRRGMHPRVFPEFFPEQPQCCFYQYQQPIQLEGRKEFNKSDFESTLYYRGGMTLVLDLIDKLGYKNIILLGVDLINNVHFYDYHPKMRWQVHDGYQSSPEINKHQLHATMLTKNGTRLPIDKYLYAVNDLYFKSKGVNFFVGSGKSRLAGRMSVYKFC